MDVYEFRECEWDGCLFRFPAEVGDEGSLRCPRCGSAALKGADALTMEMPPQPTVDGAVLAGMLDNIRSIHNVGSMFRTADGAGLQHLYLNGITATPAHPKLHKAALGAQERMPWTYGLNGPRMAQELREAGYRLIALETGARAQPLFGAEISLADAPLALVVGNERAGIDPGVLDLCDLVVALPMGGSKRTLNVAVAFGIATYALRYGGVAI